MACPGGAARISARCWARRSPSPARCCRAGTSRRCHRNGRHWPWDLPSAGGFCCFPYCASQHPRHRPDASNNRGPDCYRDAIFNDRLRKKPQQTWDHLTWVWNGCAGKLEGWPTITIERPSRREIYVLPWSAFAPSLKDVEKAALGRKRQLSRRMRRAPRSAIAGAAKPVSRASVARIVDCTGVIPRQSAAPATPRPDAWLPRTTAAAAVRAQ